jgi:hypothetical protein
MPLWVGEHLENRRWICRDGPSDLESFRHTCIIARLGMAPSR